MLVLEAFVGPRPPGLDGCHNDGNKLNNSLSNLRWATRKDNMADARTHGTDARGERHPAARITWAIARRIRQLKASSQLTYEQIAQTVGATKYQVGDVIRRASWRE